MRVRLRVSVRDRARASCLPRELVALRAILQHASFTVLRAALVRVRVGVGVRVNLVVGVMRELLKRMVREP